MNVQAVSHRSFVRRARPAAPQPPHGNTIDNPVTVSPDTDGASKTRGVIRNLESGHFRGVAELRLRINFFSELKTRAAESERQAVNVQATQIVEAVESEVQKLLEAHNVSDETAATVKELATQFGDDVETTVALLGSEATPDREALIAGLQSAFDTFLSGLSQLLFAPPDVDDSDTVPAAEKTDDETPVAVADEPGSDDVDATESSGALIDGAFTDLVAAFNGALAELEASALSAPQLPTLSSPNGNGAAYDKFLAVYNNLLAGSTNTIDATA